MDAIMTAIKRGERLIVHYPPGERLIEPHAFGLSSKGHYLLRAYQVEGVSESGEPEGWKLLRGDRILSVNATGEAFDGPRPGYKPGDSAMKGGVLAQL